ncbi:MAG: hypothetical protein ACC656_09940 [Candidatus Heimdallarchaeota archaeon]
MAKRGKKKRKIICSETFNEIEFDNSILVEVVSTIRYNTRIDKKFEKKLPNRYKLF